MRLAVVVFVITLAGCGSSVSSGTPDGGSCSSGVPDATTPRCAPVPFDAPGCRGLPTNPWGPSDPPVDAQFPLGCRVDFPEENPYYQCQGPQSCTCNAESDADGGRTARWSCPL